MVGPPEHRETHPWDCPTWVLETGCTAARGRGEQDFLSSAGNAPRWGTALPLRPPAPSLIVGVLERGYRYPGLLEGS